MVAGLRARGCDVRSAEEEQLIGFGDGEVLERATALHRVVVTHDLAFGKVEIRGGSSVGAFVILDAARRDNIRKAAQPTTSRWPIRAVRTLVEREGP